MRSNLVKFAKNNIITFLMGSSFICGYFLEETVSFFRTLWSNIGVKEVFVI